MGDLYQTEASREESGESLSFWPDDYTFHTIPGSPFMSELAPLALAFELWRLKRNRFGEHWLRYYIRECDQLRRLVVFSITL
jgi:hypothetical protein